MTEQALKTSRKLIFARNFVAMMLIALFTKGLFQRSNTAVEWVVAWAWPLLASSLLVGLYALFFTKHAKGKWLNVFYVISWFLLLFSIATPWITSLNEMKSMHQSQKKAGAKSTEQVDLFDYYNIQPDKKSEEQWWTDSPIAPSQPKQSSPNPFDKFDKPN